jgi:hypothetical protein
VAFIPGPNNNTWANEEKPIYSDSQEPDFPFLKNAKNLSKKIYSDSLHKISFVYNKLVDVSYVVRDQITDLFQYFQNLRKCWKNVIKIS